MINYIKQGWLVLVLGLAFGGALAGVQVWLGPKIDENRLNETFGQLPALVPGADGEVSKVMFTSGEAVAIEAKDIKVYNAYDSEKKLVGYAVQGEGPGYGDKIIVLVGLDTSATTITGVYVLDQKETPNLGSKITDPKWNRQYKGVATQPPLTVVKADPTAPNQIEAISGATISSDALTTLVNKTAEAFQQALAAEQAKEASDGE